MMGNKHYREDKGICSRNQGEKWREEREEQRERREKEPEKERETENKRKGRKREKVFTDRR